MHMLITIPITIVVVSARLKVLMLGGGSRDTRGELLVMFAVGDDTKKTTSFVTHILIALKNGMYVK